MRSILMIVLVTFGMATAVAAEPGKGHGRGAASDSTSEHVERAGRRVTNEAVDAVADELTGNRGIVTSGSTPPGLQGRRPPGLEKQDKTPPGWSKGKKTGWSEGQPKQESMIRRVVRGIFQRKPAQPPAN